MQSIARLDRMLSQNYPRVDTRRWLVIAELAEGRNWSSAFWILMNATQSHWILFMLNASSQLWRHAKIHLVKIGNNNVVGYQVGIVNTS